MTWEQSQVLWFFQRRSNRDEIREARRCGWLRFGGGSKGGERGVGVAGDDVIVVVSVVAEAAGVLVVAVVIIMVLATAWVACADMNGGVIWSGSCNWLLSSFVVVCASNQVDPNNQGCFA